MADDRDAMLGHLNEMYEQAVKDAGYATPSEIDAFRREEEALRARLATAIILPAPEAVQ